MLLGGNGTLAWAEQFVPNGSASVIFATVPFCVAILNENKILIPLK